MLIGSAHAALVLTDHPEGADRFEFYDSLDILDNLATGNRPITGTLNRFGLRTTNSDGQSFTLGATIILDSIYLAYNDQRSTGTFNLTIDVGNTGTANHTFLFSVTNDLQSGGNNGGPVHFLQFDVSSEDISLGAGVHSFSVAGVSKDDGTDFLFAPIFTNSDTYAGGQQLSSAGRDFIFAVTAVPEPSTGLLVAFAGSALFLRRRRA